MKRMREMAGELTPAADVEEADFTEEELEMLRALGYVGSDEQGIHERQFEIVDRVDCGF